MPKAYVTVNADDFGMTQGVTEGICQALATGIVTSASVMVCVPGTEEYVRAGQPRAAGVLGMHLQLTDGIPVLPAQDIPSLVGPDGAFPSKKTRLAARLDPDEVKAEWQAQIKRLRAWGIQPAYLDSHHHVHTRPDTLPVLIELAHEYRLPVRSGNEHLTRTLRQHGVACPDLTIIGFFGSQVSWFLLESLLTYQALRLGPNAVIEVCCHPGYSDASLAGLSHYTTQRELELEILTLESARARLIDLQFELIGMNQVAHYRGNLTSKLLA